MNRKFGIMLFLIGLLVVLVPRYILPVCEYQGYKEMSCSHTGISEMFMGVIVMAASVGMFFSKTSDTLRWSAFTIFFAGISVIVIPEAIGYCHSSRMPCNYGTIPVLRLLGGLIILLSFAGFFISFKGERNRNVPTEGKNEK